MAPQKDNDLSPSNEDSVDIKIVEPILKLIDIDLLSSLEPSELSEKVKVSGIRGSFPTERSLESSIRSHIKALTLTYATVWFPGQTPSNGIRHLKYHDKNRAVVRHGTASSLPNELPIQISFL